VTGLLIVAGSLTAAVLLGLGEWAHRIVHEQGRTRPAVGPESDEQEPEVPVAVSKAERAYRAYVAGLDSTTKENQ
jgi:hypothetical protein